MTIVAAAMPSARPTDFQARLVGLGLFVGTVLLFSRAIHYGFIDFDDPDFVTDNVHVKAGLTWESVRWAWTSVGNAANWQPLTWLSLMLDAQLFGLNPQAFHATNVLWHGLDAAMAFFALRRLTGAFGASAVGAAWFAWHPLRVESVAWIAERKDVLSVFFALAALWAYAAYAEKRRLNPLGAGRCYALALLAFGLGLLCKAMLVTLPFLLLLLDAWPLRRTDLLRSDRRESETVAEAEGWWRLLGEKLPFFALSVVACIITYSVQKAGGALGGGLPLAARVANALVSIPRYLAKFVWPFDLAVVYSPRPWPAATTIGAVLLVVLLSAGAIWQWRQRPWLAIGWCWFLGLLVPVIGLVQAGPQAMADRYTFLPTLGLEIAVLWTLREIPWVVSRPWWRSGLAALLLAGCAARTWNQLGVWHNSRTLYEHALAVTTDNYLAHGYLAATLLNEGRLDEAAAHCRRAIELAPDYGPAWFRLGVVQEKSGRLQAAMTSYYTALKRRPDLAPAHYRLAELLLSRGVASEAVAHFRSAVQRQPDSAAAWRGLGVALGRLDRPDDALAAYQHALELNPADAETHYNVGVILFGRDKLARAREHFAAALQAAPDYGPAYFGLGALAETAENVAAAVRYDERAVSLAPNNAEARYALARTLDAAGREAEALRQCELALGLDADLPGLRECAETIRGRLAADARTAVVGR